MLDIGAEKDQETSPSLPPSSTASLPLSLSSLRSIVLSAPLVNSSHLRTGNESDIQGRLLFILKRDVFSKLWILFSFAFVLIKTFFPLSVPKKGTEETVPLGTEIGGKWSIMTFHNTFVLFCFVLLKSTFANESWDAEAKWKQPPTSVPSLYK